MRRRAFWKSLKNIHNIEGKRKRTLSLPQPHRITSSYRFFVFHPCWSCRKLYCHHHHRHLLFHSFMLPLFLVYLLYLTRYYRNVSLGLGEWNCKVTDVDDYSGIITGSSACFIGEQLKFEQDEGP